MIPNNRFVLLEKRSKILDFKFRLSDNEKNNIILMTQKFVCRVTEEYDGLDVSIIIKTKNTNEALANNYQREFSFLRRAYLWEAQNRNFFFYFDRRIPKTEKTDIRILKAINTAISFEKNVNLSTNFPDGEPKRLYLEKLCKKHRNKFQKL